VGEGGTIGAPAAIANALGDALAPFGTEIFEPMTPDRLFLLVETVKVWSASSASSTAVYEAASGWANACRRAARLGVSPTTQCCCAVRPIVDAQAYLEADKHISKVVIRI
jgi:hypothetical protein